MEVVDARRHWGLCYVVACNLPRGAGISLHRPPRVRQNSKSQNNVKGGGNGHPPTASLPRQEVRRAEAITRTSSWRIENWHGRRNKVLPSSFGKLTTIIICCRPGHSLIGPSSLSPPSHDFNDFNDFTFLYLSFASISIMSSHC